MHSTVCIKGIFYQVYKCETVLVSVQKLKYCKLRKERFIRYENQYMYIFIYHTGK